jgi:hypothetical protein
MRWLSSEAPQIHWASGTITFPKEETGNLASEEDPDPDPIALIPLEYLEFAQVFSKEEFKVLLPHWDYNISIDLTPESTLLQGPIYSMTDSKSWSLKEHPETEVAMGKIRPSKSPAGTPVMFLKKANGSLQFVVDYRKLNELTINDVYPLLRQDNLMAKLCNTKYSLSWTYVGDTIMSRSKKETNGRGPLKLNMAHLNTWL